MIRWLRSLSHQSRYNTSRESLKGHFAICAGLACDQFNDAVRDVVLTVPVDFTILQHRLVIQAAIEAGYQNFSLLREPIIASLTLSVSKTF